MKSGEPFSPAVGAPVAGARIGREGVTYRVWAPDHRKISVLVTSPTVDREFPLVAETNGYWSAIDPEGKAGDLYQFLFPDGRLRPDPMSRFQPQGVHGPSACIDPAAFRWGATSWVRPAWTGQSIYEIHVGTFTSAGTYLAAIEKLNHVRDLGVEAIELMPLADFAGERNWGYDGVALYAPAHSHGHPDDLRALVDAAHERGLAVILDVVYNHLGPAGNYLSDFSARYFRSDEPTPWGHGFDLNDSHNRPVRDFIVSNAAYWVGEFRFDGLRLDATHAIADQSPAHLLEEIAAAIHARGGFLIAEDERNEARLVTPPDRGGVGLDALWADDFHHQVRVALTGTRDSYFKAYRGATADLADTLTHGWTYRGQPYAPWKGRMRGSASDHLAPASFVFCIENHDQVGNRANGERLEHLVSSTQFRAASMLLCLSPYAPLLFMGQEWAASTPFLYFTDHGGQLGRQISAGRRKEFEEHGSQWKNGLFPDPESIDTFQKSKLQWAELNEGVHAASLALHQKCLEQRRLVLHGEALRRDRWQAAAVGEFVIIRYRAQSNEYLLVVALREARLPDGMPAPVLQLPPGMKWRKILDSADPSSNDPTTEAGDGPAWKFNGPGARWLGSIQEDLHHATR